MKGKKRVMTPMVQDTSTPKDDLILLASLFLVELSVAVMSIAMYMKGARSFEVFLPSNPGIALVFAIAGILISTVGIIRQYLVRKRSPLHHYRMIVAMNFITVILILTTVEITLRVISYSTSQAVKLHGMELLPKQWEKIALYYRKLFDASPGKFYYVDYHDFMGWTVGPNKGSTDGMYWSSSEGIRAPHEGVTFADSVGREWIALVGDSFAFSQDVTYEDSWGYLLEKTLDPKLQVLNFGVPGYAIDQAYLRYEKDVLRWKPKIVIFGFIANDVIRSMTVYPFIKFPTWNWPYSKPRFIVRDGHLKKINVPSLSPEEIFSRRSITELPFLEYDSGYRENDWKKSLFRKLFLTRLFITRFPSAVPVNGDVDNSALISVNSLILQDFIRSARQNGTIPIVAYFPSKVDFASPSVKQVLTESDLARQVLEEADIPYTDLTSCLLEMNSDERFVPSKSHYSPQANALVAECLREVVIKALAQSS